MVCQHGPQALFCVFRCSSDDQPWVRYVFVSDSSTFLCSVDLAWCN
uniref:Uncharacterized protein n=1 Tax=Anguilla anguilla TaxID=7936 RepID=A0A0E9PAJ2_ANGAN